MSGITRYWKRGEDDRTEVRRRCPGMEKDTIDRVLRALFATIVSKRRTKLVGYGVFEWKPWNNRLPTGQFVKTWRLAFRPARGMRKYEEGR